MRIDVTEDLLLALVRSSLRKGLATNGRKGLNQFEICQMISTYAPIIAKNINPYMVEDALFKAESGGLLHCDDNGVWYEIETN